MTNSNNIDKQLFSERLRELFYVKDCKSIELEETLNVGRATISRWRNGHTLPNNSQIKEIADFFNVSYDWLIGSNECKNKQVDQNENTLVLLLTIKEIARLYGEKHTEEYISTLLNEIGRR